MSVVDDLGNVTIMHQETSSSDVLVDSHENTQGDNSLTAIPSDVDNLQKLVNKLGKLAFRSKVEYADLVSGFIVNDFNATIPGSALDAVAGKNLNDRLTTIENSELLIIGTEVEDSDDILPVSEINDEVASDALTWSSNKIMNYVNSVYDNYYINLYEGDDEFHFTTNETLEDIEAAFNAGKYLWVTSNVVHLPLRLRVSATEWIFSGYTDGRACDIKIDSTGVTRTYTDVITRNILDTQYDEKSNSVIFQ